MIDMRFKRMAQESGPADWFGTPDGWNEALGCSITDHVNQSWMPYDQTVAEAMLHNFGEIYLDEYGLPIDDEYWQQEIYEERQSWRAGARAFKAFRGRVGATKRTAFSQYEINGWTVMEYDSPAQTTIRKVRPYCFGDSVYAVSANGLDWEIRHEYETAFSCSNEVIDRISIYDEERISDVVYLLEEYDGMYGKHWIDRT